MAAKDSDISDLQKQELEESTSCCICTDIYKCPKLLTCGHTFCMNCIQETGLKTSKVPGDEMPCPVCRQQFRIPSQGFTGLQNNYFVEGLIRVAQILDPSKEASITCDACLEENREKTGKEVPRADMYCADCKEKLCEECCRHHRKVKLTKNHKLLSINKQSPTGEDLIQSLVPIVCELHKHEDLKIYCCVCKTVVCAICFTEHHEGHKGTYVTKAVDDFRKEIATNIDAVKTCISQAEMKKSEMKNAKQDVHAKLVGLECDITSRKEGLKQVAEKHSTSLLEELSSTRQSIMKEIHIETDNIDAQMARLESYNSYCNKIITKGSACDICRSVGDLSVRVNEIQVENQSLIDRQLKPLSLCFIETEFEEEDEGNMIGQLKEQDHSKQKTKPKQRLIEELKKENDTLKAEIKTNEAENEDLRLANQKLRQNLDKREQNNNVSKLRQELENEKLTNKALEAHINKLTEQIKHEKMKTTLLQANTDTLVTEGNPNKEPTRTVQWHTVTAASNASQPRGSFFTVLNQSDDSLMLSALHSMTIEVKRNDLTRIRDVDVLVSSINHQLDMDGPMAQQIMSVAGHNVKKELLSHKHQLRFLETGCLVNTSAGYLKGIKAIIHVVRPQLSEFPPSDQRSRDALKNVFVNCLRYTIDELKLKSICLPPVGFIYGAEMVVDCFLDAVKTFASTVGNGNPSAATQHQPHQFPLTYIQLVTNDFSCIGQLIRCFKQRLDAF